MSKMKNSPLKFLICIVDKDKADTILKILKKMNEENTIMSIVETQHKNWFTDVMGLAKTDSVIYYSLINTQNAEFTMQGLDLILSPDNKQSFGLAFTINLSSISRETMDYIVNNYKEDNKC